MIPFHLPVQPTPTSFASSESVSLEDCGDTVVAHNGLVSATEYHRVLGLIEREQALRATLRTDYNSALSCHQSNVAAIVELRQEIQAFKNDTAESLAKGRLGLEAQQCQIREVKNAIRDLNNIHDNATAAVSDKLTALRCDYEALKAGLGGPGVTAFLLRDEVLQSDSRVSGWVDSLSVLLEHDAAPDAANQALHSDS
uniref:Uncharacterized protein n=1 Tax=Mycena chlorophos TaxID=658473 RepID=A0ABQ0KUI3_MYCCL|nr:predicted protein [Mycena chlorophos]